MPPPAPLLRISICLWILSLSSLTHGQFRVPRILNGVVTDEFESVGIVGSVELGGFCSGTLISPIHVLTAAHCAEGIESSTAGLFEVNGNLYGTVDIFIHRDYNSRTLDNDIAILELDEPVLDVNPSLIFRDAPRIGDELIIVGFGSGGDADSGGDGSFGVRMFGVTFIDDVTDTLVIWEFDDPAESNTSSGDSGGPGLLEIDGELFIASVTSSGSIADGGLGDVAFNTRVDAYSDWIDAVVEIGGGAIDDEVPVDNPDPGGGDQAECPAGPSDPVPPATPSDPVAPGGVSDPVAAVSSIRQRVRRYHWGGSKRSANRDRLALPGNN